MPLYEYQCEHHGVFEKVRPVSRRKESAACPECGTMVRKVFSLPVLRAMMPAMVNAHERNERSREAPHVCGSRCNHGHTAKPAPVKREGEKPALQRYQGKRPWVIEHA